MLITKLMKVLLEKVMDEQCTFKGISLVALLSGVKIHGFHFLFGQHDGTTLFEALGTTIAKHFILRATPQTYTTGIFAISAEKF